MSEVSANHIPSYQPILLSNSFVNPQGNIIQKESPSAPNRFSLIGICLMFIWAISTYLFTPQYLGQVIPAALIISALLSLKAFEIKPQKYT